MEEKKTNIAVPIVIGGLLTTALITGGIIYMGTQDNTNQSTQVNSDNLSIPVVGEFKDGVYNATGSYQTPDGTEQIAINLTIKNGRIERVEATPQADNSTSLSYQRLFSDGISSKVVGLPLSADFRPSNINGSSLTSTGFKDALNQIKNKAQI